MISYGVVNFFSLRIRRSTQIQQSKVGVMCTLIKCLKGTMMMVFLSVHMCFSDYVVKNQFEIFSTSLSTDIELIISGSIKHFYVSEGIEPYQ
jgi:hypothetical protein